MYLHCSGEVLVESFDFGLCGVSSRDAARNNFFSETAEVFLDQSRAGFDGIVLFFFGAIGFVGGESFFEGITELWEESRFWYCW